MVPLAFAQPQTGFGVGVGLGVEVGSGVGVAVGSGVGVVVGSGVGVAVGTVVVAEDTEFSLPEVLLELPLGELSLLLAGWGVGVFELPEAELPPKLLASVISLE